MYKTNYEMKDTAGALNRPFTWTEVKLCYRFQKLQFDVTCNRKMHATTKGTKKYNFKEKLL